MTLLAVPVVQLDTSGSLLRRSATIDTLAIVHETLSVQFIHVPVPN